MFAVVFLSLILVVLFSVIQIRKRNKYNSFYNLPSPSEFPLLGISLKLLLANDHFKLFLDIYKEHGLPCRFLLKNISHYSTDDPADIKIVFTNPNTLEKGHFYEFLSVAFDESLLVADAEMWKEKRKILSKCFNKNLLNGFVPIFNEHNKTFVNKLRTYKFKNSEDIFHTFQTMTSTVFLETMMDTSDTEKDFGFVISKGQECIFKRIYNVFYHINFIYERTAEGKDFQKLVYEYKGEMSRIIDKRKEHVKKANLENNDLRKVLIDVMVELEQSGALTRENTIYETFLFTAAATDTTSNTVAFTCALLGMHPEIQNKVLDEVLKVIGPTKDIEYTDLPNLKYTEQVLNESMRILPVIPMVMRNATDDIELDSKIVIPKGSDVIVSIINLHRNKKYYPNPTKFDPERFSPEEVAKRHPYAFLPFAGGPRNCIGNKYAMMLMKVTLSYIVRNFFISSKLKSVEELNLRSFIAMSATNLDVSFDQRIISY